MNRILFIFILAGCFQSAPAQVNKLISIAAIPENAKVTKISGRSDLLGNTPLEENFNFHSDMSILKLKLSACGYYDTIVKINPQTKDLLVELERKHFVMLPAAQKDVLSDEENAFLSELLNTFLILFIECNAAKPINFYDFAVVYRSEAGFDINLLFELDPQYLSVSRSMDEDSVLQDKWNNWFASPLKELVLNQKNGSYPVDLYFSVISGKSNLSVRHMPGVDVRDELRVEVSVYEDQYHRVTTTTSYYETVTTPEFNTQLNQSKKYYEMLYRADADEDGKHYLLTQKAMLCFRNGRLYTNYTTSSEITAHSMLNNFLDQ